MNALKELLYGLARTRPAWAFAAVAALSILLSGCIEMSSPQVRRTLVHLPTEEVRDYYVSLEERLMNRGLLKTNAGADAGFSASNLTRNFERIALSDEFQLRNNTLVKSNEETLIRRWEDPVRVSLYFGESFPDDLRRADTEFILDYLGRLQQLTGRSISVVSERANFHILVLNSEELSKIGSQLPRLNLPRNQLISAQIANYPIRTLCSVFALTDRRRDSRYLTAIVVVKAEHPELLRRACYHEEIAQGLGLTNDSLEARPSIFNDNEEYAYLTNHDELLLRILYDPRLRTGMSRYQAMPVVERLARELRPESQN